MQVLTVSHYLVHYFPEMELAIVSVQRVRAEKWDNQMVPQWSEKKIIMSDFHFQYLLSES